MNNQEKICIAIKNGDQIMWLQLFLFTLGLSSTLFGEEGGREWKKICWTIKSNSFWSHSEQIIIMQYPHTYIMTYTKIWDFSSFMQCLKKIHKSIALKLKVMWSFRQVETVYRMHFSLWIDLFFFSAWIILGTLNFEDYWQQCPENDMKKLPLFLQISVSHTHPHTHLSWSF